MITQKRIINNYFHLENTPNRQFICRSITVLLFLMLAVAPATACATMTVPETTITDLFSTPSNDDLNIQLDTGTTITPDSLNNLQNAISDTSHSFSYDSATGVYSCYNDAQKTALTTTGGEVVISAPGGDTGFTLVSVGREDRLQPAEKGEISTDGRTLSISGDGYTEWYRNNDQAIMQGMDLVTRPEGQGNLLVSFDLSGDLNPSMDNQVLTLSNEDGPVMAYKNLNAWDSTGRTLNAAMTLKGDTLTWEVDDSHAIYPVTIDPVLTLEQAVYGQKTFDYFGSFVSVSGNYALIGAYCNDTVRSGGGVDAAGAAYFYKTADAGETWTLKQSEYGQIANEWFGSSVSLSGDYAVIGAKGNDTVRSTTPNMAGAAYFYKTADAGETWTLKQAEYGQIESERFGKSVSLSGNYALIGAYQNNTVRSAAVNFAGAAYFYKTADAGETWTLKQAEYGPKMFDYFGSSVSLSGDYALIGAYGNDTVRSTTPNKAGAAYFYKTGDAGETWTLKQSEYGQIADDYFGSSVSLSGDYALIGSYLNDTVRSTAPNWAGAAYFYKTADAGETWTLKQSEYGQIANEQLGKSVSLSGDYALIGAYWNDTVRSTAPDSAGAAYFYKTADAGETWTLKQSEYGQIVNEWFGKSVSLSGDYAVIGAEGNDTVRSTTPNMAGAAYFYLIRPTISTYTPADDAVDVAIDSNLVAKFDENVAAVAGKNIVIKKTADDTVVQTIAADDAAVTVADDTVTINPNDFAYGTGYYVQIDAGAFKSATNVPFAGIADTTTWSFTTIAAAPTVVSATTNAAGTVITVTFDKTMSDPAGKHGEFMYQINGGADQAFGAAALNADTTKIDLNCGGTAIANGDAVTLSYTTGTVTSADGGVLATFAAQAVTNAIPAQGGAIVPDPGDGGGGSSGNAGVASNVMAGDTAQVFMNGEESAVYEVDIKVNQDTKEILVTAKKESLPPGVPSPGTQTYQYDDIKAYKVDPSAIDEAAIDFSVKRSWLTENGFEPTDVVMKHYNAETQTWEDIPTEVVSVTGGNVYYRAVTPGFSHFSICYEKGGAVMDLTSSAAPVSTPAEVSAPSTPAPASPTATQAPAPAQNTAGTLPVTTIIIAVVVVLIVAVGGIAIHKRRQEEYPDWWYQEEE